MGRKVTRERSNTTENETLSTTMDPDQFQQILALLQEISTKLDALQLSNQSNLNHLVDQVFNNMISYHLLTR